MRLDLQIELTGAGEMTQWVTVWAENEDLPVFESPIATYKEEQGCVYSGGSSLVWPVCLPSRKASFGVSETDSR